ncbi:MAG: polysaccharide deacetylase family protein [Planctomycetota bacterium]|nr:polysaccharide deacetylase family protein [Planctomycetota bacterium]
MTQPKTVSAYRNMVAEKLDLPPSPAILSIDLEEYYNYVPYAEELVAEQNIPKRAHETLPHLLDLLETHGVRATFFVLASIIDNVEPLLGRIVEAGHEIACHGWSHKRVHKMTPEEFRRDVVRSRNRIMSATGVRPLGYRAPSFSMSGETGWAFDVLADEGFVYDSSIAPLKNFFYGGVADAPFGPHRLKNGLVEFPLPVYKLGKFRILIGGGFYLRLFPLWLNRYFLRRYERRYGCPPVIYIHPWEFDDARYNLWDLGAKHPMLAEQGRLMKWIGTYNRHRALKRFDRLLRTRRWTTFQEALT